MHPVSRVNSLVEQKSESWEATMAVPRCVDNCRTQLGSAVGKRARLQGCDDTYIGRACPVPSMRAHLVISQACTRRLPHMEVAVALEQGA
jgi:hypothetical protein